MKTRRVVTDNNKDGRSFVKYDTEIESKAARAGFEKLDLWATDSLPARLTQDDPATWDFGTTLANGSVFRLCLYEPGVAERWHRTDSLDYGIVLYGEIDMQLDEGEVHLITGDTVIQRGTLHNWVNRGTKSCLIAFILIATEGGVATGW
jgi:quercetin dioxygenase-like cupin family protein